LLRPRRKRPRCRAAEQRDNLAPVHSITSSARASSVGGMVRPIALAVVALTTSAAPRGGGAGRCRPSDRGARAPLALGAARGRAGR
jgi:hypothetical protein